jgi:hypothetical protein
MLIKKGRRRKGANSIGKSPKRVSIYPQFEGLLVIISGTIC